MSAFTDFLTQLETAKTYLLEVDVWDGAAVRTLYYGTTGFVTTPTDTPANTHYKPRIKTPLLSNRSMYSGNQTTTRSLPQYGDIELDNTDGALDGLAAYGFDGRECRFYLGGDGFARSDFGLIFRGKVLTCNVGVNAVVLKLRDIQEEINTPIQSARYAGTGGVNGTASLKDRFKPLTYGRAYNVSPVVVDPANLLFQVHDGQINAILAVYDNGATLPAANYTVNAAAGTFTLSNSPVGQITADVEGAKESGTWLNTAAKIMRSIALRCGVPAAQVKNAAFTALDALAPQVVGLYIDGGQEVNAMVAMDDVARSVGAFYGADRDGLLTCGRLDLPAAGATPVLTLDESNILRAGLEPLPPASWVKRIVVNYRRNFTVQSESSLAGIVVNNPDAYNFKTNEYRTASYANDGVLTAHPYAEDLNFDTLLADPADATAEAQRLASIYGNPPAMFKVVCKLQAYAISVNDVVTLAHSRFGLTAGKKMRVLAINERSSRNEVELVLWGAYGA